MNTFAQDVAKGLSSPQKHLSSKYFYDKRGSEIFQKIMCLEEYYPTNCEKEIFQTYAQQWQDYFCEGQEMFNLLEFGAGDGLKTKILLKSLLAQNSHFTYYPIDISKDILEVLEQSLAQEMPTLQVQGIAKEYFEALRSLKEESSIKEVVLFLGSNLGNFPDDEAVIFLTKIKEQLKPHDLFMIGLDLKKEPEVILKAYSDSEGVTREFNLNLLRRINNELEANFVIEDFEHYASYDASTGICKSFLISKENQEVYIKALDQTFEFEKWEAIHTENSQKYSFKQIERMAQESGFEVVEHFTDSKGYFVDSLWKVK